MNWILLPLLLNADPLLPVSEVDPKTRQLVNNLGDLNFRVRERATRELKSLRFAAIPALIDGLRDTDVERSTRCRQILPEIEWWKNPSLLKFVLDPKSDPPGGMPELSRFFSLTGDCQESRELYAEMLTVHASRLGTSRGDPDLMEQVFVSHRQQSLSTRGAHWDLRFEPEFFETRAGATLYFFLASDRRFDDRHQLPQLDRTPLGNSRLGRDWLRSIPFQKLYLDWAMRESSWFLKRKAIETALQAKIDAALPTLSLLERLARTPNEIRDCAELLLIARDFPPDAVRTHIGPLLASGKMTDHGISVADVALGVLLLAEGKSLRDHGLVDGKGLLQLDWFRVIDADRRDQATKDFLKSK